ncbi:MAG: hypothetical protein GKR94_07550 [Gammaproteobacteria bacterium]|nr:hypothetical protein [Gammaproteobacteria bacterium]
MSPTTGDVLSAAYDQRLIVWPADTLEPKLQLERVPTTWERSLSFAPDGQRIVAGSFDGTVLVWDANSGALLQEVGTRDGQAGNACFNDVSSNGSDQVAMVGDDGYLRLGTLSAKQNICNETLEPRSGRMLMNAVSFDHSGQTVACGAHNHRLHLFSREQERIEEIEVNLGEGPINSIRFAEHPGYEGEAFAGCYSSRIVRVGQDGSIRGRIGVHEGAVKALRLHPEQTLGVSCGADGLLLSWSFEGELLRRFPGHQAIINDVDLSPGGDRLVSVSRDFSLNVYELNTGLLLHSIALGRRSLKSVCYWDEDLILIGDYWGKLISVRLCDEQVHGRTIAANGISSVTRSGDHLAAVSYDGGAYLVDVDHLEVVQTMRTMEQRIPEAAAGAG